MVIQNSRWVFASVGRAAKRFAILIAAGAGLMTVEQGQGSILYIGNSNGEVFGRDEYDLATHMPQNYINYGSGVTVNALAGVGGNVAIGINTAPNVDVRPVNSLSTVVSTLSTGNATTALAAGPSGQVAIGDSGNLLFLRQSTNLLDYPAGYTSTDGLNFGSPISATAILPNGNVVVATQSGVLAIRSGTDLFNVPNGSVTGFVNYGTPITALAVDATGKIVIGLENGLLDVRAPEDISISLSSVNFGTKINAVSAMLDGTGIIAIGLENGLVSVRQTSDVTINLQTVAFTVTEAVTALAYSADGNLAVGTETNLVFIRDGSNLQVVPEGFVGPDGLNFNGPITALTFAIPEPSTYGMLIVALIASGFLLRRKSAPVAAK